ncbi:RHS repeat-associated core domain-containing protein [Dactylosporangium sp. NPDC048998]|uniref:RHS repeat domain-containing protein n=1 Tax=Dactylosporangium sp. NPDC048998 TaxID=3363976 RepID=UPI00371275F1
MRPVEIQRPDRPVYGHSKLSIDHEVAASYVLASLRILNGEARVGFGRVSVFGSILRLGRAVRGGWGRTLAVALVLALMVTVVDLSRSPVRASAAPSQLQQASAAPDVPLERPDEQAALVTARVTGKRVRIADATSETVVAMANPDGSVSVESAVEPQRARVADGRWADVDLRLRPGADGRLRPAVSVADVRFSAGGSGPLVELVRDGHSMTLSWPGVLPAGVVAADAVTYPEVLPGADLVLRATRTGFTHVWVLKSAAAAANPALRQIRFRLGGDTRVSGSADGSLRAMVGDRVMAWSQPASMWDSTVPLQMSKGADSRRGRVSEDPVPAAEALRSTSEGAGDGAQVGVVGTQVTGDGDLVLTPDRGLLDDPAVSYPMFVDPSWSVSASTWAYATSNNESNDTTSARVGLNSTTGALYRSFFSFPMTSGSVSLPGKYIQSATVQMNLEHSWSCGDTPTHLYRTPAINASPKASWSSMTLSVWLASAGSHANKAGGCGANQPDMLVNFTNSALTADLQFGADRSWPSYTVGLCACDSAGQYESTQDRWKKFYTNGGKLLVTYTSYATVNALSTVPSAACATGSDRPFINTKTPQLKAQVSDPEGAQVTAKYEWWVTNGALIGSSSQGPAASGSWTTAVVPSGAFAEGGTYSWRVRGNDGIVDGPWSSFCEFTVDTVAPSVPPSVSSSNYPEGQWAGGAGTAGSFTFGASGVSDVATYEYGLDVNPPNQTVNASSLGGGASVSVPVSNDGPHTLNVRSVDRAGNTSATRSYAFNAGSAGVTAPKTGDITAAKTAITAVGSPGITSVTYQWRRGDADAWTNIPASDVTKAAGGGAVTWPLASGTGGQFEKLNWDVAKTLKDAEGGPDPLDGPLQLRGLFNGGAASSPVVITFDKDNASAATTTVGPCKVNLITGNCTLSDSDVSVRSYESDLTVTRSFNTRRAAQTDSANMFGPGWVSSVAVEEAGAPYTGLTRFGSLVQVGLPDGDTIGFAKKANVTGGESFDPEIGMEVLKLTYTTASDAYTLTDQDGNTVMFTRVSGAPAGAYSPTAITVPGSGQTTTIGWEKVTVSGTDRVRPTRMLAPVPDGVNCTTMTRGCRALTFTYATATTATGTGEGQWGDYLGRVTQISFTAWDPDATPAGMRTVALARYAYDNSGRLCATWDPRLDWSDAGGVHHLWNRYAYDGDGIITTVTPSAQEPWQLSYTTVPADSGKGRLKAASRSALAAGTDTTTVVYRVPISGTGAPYNMSGAQTTRWYQNEPPTDAAAVFPATQVPNGDQAAGTLPSSWERAAVAYLDANGRQVNTAQPGGHISTIWYDQWGNVTRTLTAGNRRLALDMSPTDTPSQEADLARDRSTMNIYSSDGQRLTETWGPGHDVVLDNGSVVRARAHTKYTYDEGAPGGGPYNLVTTKDQHAYVFNNGTGQWVAYNSRVTKTEYDWTLRQPTATIVDPAGLALKTRTAYDPVTGLVTSTTTPPGGASDTTPATRKNVYYRATSGSGYAECDLKPEWANLPCRIQPGGQAATGPELPVTVTTYDMFNQPRVATEKTSAGTLRTTTTTYDSAGRAYETSITAAGGLGTAVPKQRHVYDQATGEITRTQSIDGGGQVTAEIVRGYDTLGRQTSYTDADANTSTTSYDLLSRPNVVNDGKAARTYTYDGGSERRGLATSVNDAQAGAFTGTYDADGNLTSQSWPNGIVATTEYDETGTPVGRTYTKPGCGQTDCTLYSESVTESIHGQRRNHISSLSSQEYTYDQAGRLITVKDSVGGQCTTRAYRFADPKSHNRTSLTEYSPDPTGGGCQTSTPDSTRSWTYDTADRITTPGTVYDALGRTTTVPAADTANPAGGNVTIGYHHTDLVKSISQGGRTTDYTLDVGGERVRSWTDNATGTLVQATHHYDGDGDNPVWTQETATRYTRVLVGVTGMAGIWNSDTATVNWQLANIRGDVIATINAGDTGLSTTSEATEYGTPRNPAQIGNQRYGWLGAKQRAADTPTGIVLMGVRLYNTLTGRFMQIDPIANGSANGYDYCNADGVNCVDLSGMAPGRGFPCKCTKSNSQWSVVRVYNYYGPWRDTKLGWTDWWVYKHINWPVTVNWAKKRTVTQRYIQRRCHNGRWERMVSTYEWTDLMVSWHVGIGWFAYDTTTYYDGQGDTEKFLGNSTPTLAGPRGY